MHPESASLASAGRRLGPYALLAKLGAGGMGTVFLALQRGIGGFEKKVALKCINREAADDRQFVAMLVDEARLMAQLTHPNIVQVIDLAEHDGLHYVVMEYVEGIDARTLSCSFELDLDEAVHIVAEAARGLAYAHRKCGPDGAPLGIVHRDISGHNLLVSSEGIAKVLDFGIAKAASNRHRTEIGVLKGKLAYMSPEQAMGKALDARSDLFSLGIVLWELCTRQRLFVGDTEIQLLMKVQRCEIEPPGRIVDGFPRRLEDIILKCLAADPEDRYADGERLADDLMEFQRTHLGAVSPRNKLAKKVATYLREHPAAPLDDASSSFGGEKTIAAPAVEATMAFTRANQAVSSRPEYRRRRQIAALAMIALVAATLGLAWKYGVPILRNGSSIENAPDKAAMLPPPVEKTPVVSASPGSPSKQQAANEIVPPAGLTYRSQSGTATVEARGRAIREPFGEPELSAQPEKPAAVAVRQPDVSANPRREGHASLKGDAPPPTYMKVGNGNSTYMQVGKPEAPSQTSPPPPEAEAETPAADLVEATASLSLNASPWARVYIDGVAVAESTPLLRHSLAAGKHKIVLVNPELRLRRELDLELKPGEHHRQTISLE